MLHLAGQDVQDVFSTLPDTGDAADYEEAVDALNAYFIPHVNTALARFAFQKLHQKPGETVQQFATRLRQGVNASSDTGNSSSLREHRGTDGQHVRCAKPRDCTELIPTGNMETGMLKVKRKTTTLMMESAIDVEVLSTGGEIPNALHEEQHATRVRGKTTMQKCAAPKAGR